MSEKSTPMSIEAKPKGRPQSERMARALAMVAAGSTKYAAAKATGCTASALYRALKRGASPDPGTSEPAHAEGPQVV